jgi:hypothetical protein
MANPFHAAFTWSQLILNIYVFAGLPLLLLLHIRMTDEVRPRYVLGFAATALLMSPSFTNPILVVTAWILLLAYDTLVLLTHRNDKERLRRILSSTGLQGAVFLLVCSWWLLPLVGSVHAEYRLASQVSIGYSNLDVFKLSSRDTSFLNVFRMLGHWALRDGFAGDEYYPWMTTYDSPVFVIMTFLVTLFTFSCVVWTRNNEVRFPVVYFSVVAILGLFVVKGSHSPLGEINVFLFRTVPFFDALRNHYEKLGILVVLGYSFLFGFAASRLISWCGQKRLFRGLSGASVALVILGGALLLYNYPFWSADLIYRGGKVLRSYFVKVPEYYFQLKRGLDRSGDYRVLELPLVGLYGSVFDWEQGYQGWNMTWRILEVPSLSTSYRNELLCAVDEGIRKGWPVDLATVLALTNGRYVLFHEDMKHGFFGIDVNRADRVLRSQETPHLVAVVGKLRLYEIEEELRLPRVFAVGGSR